MFDLLQSFHDETYSGCIFRNLRKAFDTVNYDILFTKVQAHVVLGNVCSLVDSYLSLKNQYVLCTDKKSDVFFITADVPQGPAT